MVGWNSTKRINSVRLIHNVQNAIEASQVWARGVKKVNRAASWFGVPDSNTPWSSELRNTKAEYRYIMVGKSWLVCMGWGYDRWVRILQMPPTRDRLKLGWRHCMALLDFTPWWVDLCSNKTINRAIRVCDGCVHASTSGHYWISI